MKGDVRDQSLRNKKKEVFELAGAKERRARCLDSLMCDKDEYSKILVEDNKIKERQRSYFDRLFNEVRFENSQCDEQRYHEQQHNSRSEAKCRKYHFSEEQDIEDEVTMRVQWY